MKWDQNNPEKVKDFIAKMKQDYAFKKAYAARRAWEFYNHPDVAGMCYVAVGGLDMVLHLSNGTEAGVVLGRPWSEKNKPPEGSKGLYRKDLARSPGEAMIRYKDGTMTIKAAKLVIDGTVTVSGDVTAGGVSLDNHTHTDSMGGGTSGPS